MTNQHYEQQTPSNYKQWWNINCPGYVACLTWAEDRKDLRNHDKSIDGPKILSSARNPPLASSASALLQHFLQQPLGNSISKVHVMSQQFQIHLSFNSSFNLVTLNYVQSLTVGTSPTSWRWLQFRREPGTSYLEDQAMWMAFSFRGHKYTRVCT